MIIDEYETQEKRTYSYDKPQIDVSNIIEMDIHSIKSRKVRITRPAQMINNLREVEVFGYEINDNPPLCLLDNLDGTSSVKECDGDKTKTPGLLTLYPSGEVTSSPYGNCLSPPHPGTKTVTFEKCSRDDVNSARWTIERPDIIDESNTNAFRLQHEESGQCKHIFKVIFISFSSYLEMLTLLFIFVGLSTEMKYEFLKGAYKQSDAKNLCQDWPKLEQGGYESTLLALCATNTWRLYLNSSQSIWDVLKIKMFQGSEEMFPIAVDSSNYNGRHRPENVQTTDGIWGGRHEPGNPDIYWVEFTFSEPTCISEAIWQNHENHFANGEVKLQGKHGDQWVDYGAKTVLQQGVLDSSPKYQVNMISQQESTKWRLIADDGSDWDASKVKMFDGLNVEVQTVSFIDHESYVEFTFPNPVFIAKAEWLDATPIGTIKLQYEKVINAQTEGNTQWVSIVDYVVDEESLNDGTISYDYSNQWRISAINQHSPWDLLRLRFFSGSTELEPDSVFESGSIAGSTGYWGDYFGKQNVLYDRSDGRRWGGRANSNGEAYIGYFFATEVFVTKVIWENFVAHQADDKVKLEARIDGTWTAITEEKEAVKVPSSWDTLSHPQPLMKVATTIANAVSCTSICADANAGNTDLPTFLKDYYCKDVSNRDELCEVRSDNSVDYPFDHLKDGLEGEWGDAFDDTVIPTDCDNEISARNLLLNFCRVFAKKHRDESLVGLKYISLDNYYCSHTIEKQRVPVGHETILKECADEKSQYMLLQDEKSISDKGNFDPDDANWKNIPDREITVLMNGILSHMSDETCVSPLFDGEPFDFSNYCDLNDESKLLTFYGNGEIISSQTDKCLTHYRPDDESDFVSGFLPCSGDSHQRWVWEERSSFRIELDAEWEGKRYITPHDCSANTHFFLSDSVWFADRQFFQWESNGRISSQYCDNQDEDGKTYYLTVDANENCEDAEIIFSNDDGVTNLAQQWTVDSDRKVISKKCPNLVLSGKRDPTTKEGTVATNVVASSSTTSLQQWKVRIYNSFFVNQSTISTFH